MEVVECHAEADVAERRRLRGRWSRRRLGRQRLFSSCALRAAARKDRHRISWPGRRFVAVFPSGESRQIVPAGRGRYNVYQMRFLLAAFAAAAFAAPGYDPSLWSGLRYRMIGPERGGRVTTVTGVPSQPT